MAPPVRESLTREACAALDAAPHANAPLADRFAPGAEGVIYLDANSVGPMPKAAAQRLAALLDKGWRVARRRSWNESDWLDQPRSLGAALARLLGAGPGDLLVADTTSINHHKLLRLALAASAPRRSVIVVEEDVFPSNRYAAEAIAHAAEATLRPVAEAGEDALRAALVPGDVAVVSLSHVDYRSGERLPMAALTALAHEYGALVLWDLSHSAGALAADLRGANVDLALGCGYKYLSGGPGAPSWLYVHPRWQHAAWPALAGWMGHADTFAFARGFEPAPGIGRFAVGTPAVIANAAFGAAADIWREVDPAALDARHRSLTETLVRLADEQLAPRGVVLAGPREHKRRGGHVALRFEQGNVHALGQALVAEGVVASTRKPDSLRLAPHPLVTRHVELFDAVGHLAAILDEGRWREPRFQGPSV
jgi:kynureninase